MTTTTKKLKEFKTEFDNITLFKIFEIEVIDIKSNEPDYIIFNISIDGTNLKAQHVGLTEKEENSKFISFKSIEIDTDFSMDENLQELSEECTSAIIDSTLYKLV